MRDFFKIAKYLFHAKNFQRFNKIDCFASKEKKKKNKKNTGSFI